MLVTPLFVGMSSAGFYQINLIIPPGTGQGDVPIQGWVGGHATQNNVYLSLQGGTYLTSCVYTGDGGGSGDGGGVGDGGGGGDGGGDGGDGGDGG